MVCEEYVGIWFLTCRITDGESWAQEAYSHIAEMTKGTIIYTQIISYTEDGIPLVHCYVAIGPQVGVRVTFYSC